ncbi:hypothetical protein [Kineococcus sp. SYSU DK005]|uniref:hypothetical protein n=1 Tax=Kineococcus sp. SYSU DK005 TaxID=3383126 RepID=UPI003D7F01B3
MNRTLARLTALPLATAALSTAALLGLSGAANAATPTQNSTTQNSTTQNSTTQNSTTQSSTTQSSTTAHARAGAVHASLTQGSTGMTIVFDNNSDQPLTLVSATNPYGHWQDRAPQTIPAHTTGVSISDYSNNIEGSEIDVTYALPDGSQVTFQGLVPLAGSDSISGSTTSPAYVLHGQSDAGFHPTYHFQLANA